MRIGEGEERRSRGGVTETQRGSEKNSEETRQIIGDHNLQVPLL